MSEITAASPNAKIWRYMDLAKFISLLSSESLYFACPSEFSDPYEGYLPQSHINAHKEINQKFIDEQMTFKDQIVALHPDKDLREFILQFNNNLKQYKERTGNALSEASLKFGVNCWHKSEYESEAMWKMYQQYGIAIESTTEQLYNAILDKTGIYIDNVRYMDFENDPIEKGNKHYLLFIKRKSFEHEKELRAIIMLENPGKGTFIKCNLDVLINRIHISPYAAPYLKQAIENLCMGNLACLNKRVLSSLLFDTPN